MRRVAIALILSPIMLLSGCYDYVPADPGSIPAGTQIRARLSDAGSEGMRGFFGPGVYEIKGPLAAWGGNGLSILRETYVRRQGFPPTTLTDTLRLQPNYLAGVDIKELNGTRTAILTVGIVGGSIGALFLAQIFGGTQDAPGEGQGPPPDDAVIVRIPFRIGIPIG